MLPKRLSQDPLRTIPIDRTLQMLLGDRQRKPRLRMVLAATLAR
jgi:hypothetical protein